MINPTSLISPSYNASSSPHSSSNKPSKLTETVKNVANQTSLDHSQTRQPRALRLSVQKSQDLKVIKQAVQSVRLSKVLIRHRWTKEEDEKLKKLVAKHRKPKSNKPDWPSICKNMGFTEKRCRERYMNHLKEGVNCTDLTDLEKTEIIQFGKDNAPNPKWTVLAKKWNRTSLQVKNYWHCQLNKKNGAIKRKLDGSPNLRNDESPQKKKKTDHNSSSSSNASEGQHLIENDQEMTVADQTSVLVPTNVKPPAKPKKKAPAKDYSKFFALKEQFAIVQSVKKNGRRYVDISKKLKKKYWEVSNFYLYAYSKEPETYEARFREWGLYRDKLKQDLSKEEGAASHASETSQQLTPQSALKPPYTFPNFDFLPPVLSFDIEDNVEMRPADPKVIESETILTEEELPQPMITSEIEASQQVNPQLASKPFTFPNFVYSFPPPPPDLLEEALSNFINWNETEESGQLLMQDPSSSIKLSDEELSLCPTSKFSGDSFGGWSEMDLS